MEFMKLILVLSMLCLADGYSCSLELRPARAVVAFGDPISVSCVASRPVRVLGWEAAVGAANTQRDLTVQWGVDSLTDWIEEPICYGVFFTAPRQCEEKLHLVLYKTPDSVSISSLNQTGPMQEGRQYQLQCEVHNIAPVQYLNLRWFREQTEVYNHTFSDLTPASPVQVSSTLLITPRRADDGAQYRCVAELDLGPEGPQPPLNMTSEPLSITVQYAPYFLSPNAEIIEVNKGDEVTLNCTAQGNPPPVYSWNISHSREKESDDQAVFISSSLSPGIYTCTSTNRLGMKNKQFTIKHKSRGA
ncbi:intercellular adhesion molecule 5-like [Scleropages formosus]|uniref:Si:ch211-66e2.5 n=1 Tax=Scleropages formosus TaxID=113540 RepID=A0A8C9SM45_SCLFO|nr:intercellular adhesion molecule 1 [Scleropages formosus]